MSEDTAGNRRRGKAIRAALVLAGFLAFFPGIREFGRSYSQTLWPITPGRVTSSGAVEKNGRLEVAVEYEYILSGRLRRGRMPVRVSSRAAAESLGARFPTGKEIAVGYDPGNPALSVLRPRIRWWSLVLAVAGAGLMAGGLWPRKH